MIAYISPTMYLIITFNSYMSSTLTMHYKNIKFSHNVDNSYKLSTLMCGTSSDENIMFKNKILTFSYY